MVQAIADRFAEALAEYLHKNVRVQHWGYSADEELTNEALIKEEYKGIRPAPGYPACPDHLEKETIWKLLDVEEQIGVTLTESMAMCTDVNINYGCNNQTLSARTMEFAVNLQTEIWFRAQQAYQITTFTSDEKADRVFNGQPPQRHSKENSLL